MAEKFKILSIDGGGIRGVFPAKILACLEEEIGEGQIHKHFDLICGTSTGGIIALALSLGIPAREILDLYQKNAKIIFGNKSYNIFKKPFYDNKPLEKLLKDIFLKYHNKVDDPRIQDAKIKLLIPTYSLLDSSTQVLKTPHTDDLTVDRHIPMYMAAMATSAAPTFFNAYSNHFKKIDSETIEYFSNKVDGGVYANNPSMIGIIEANTRFKTELKDIKLLSLGTGQKEYSNAEKKENWHVWFWIWKKKIIELFMQSQSKNIHNSVSVLNKFNKGFIYKRIDTKFDNNFNVTMDETDSNKLDKLAEKSSRVFQTERNYILETFFNDASK